MNASPIVYEYKTARAHSVGDFPRVLNAEATSGGWRYVEAFKTPPMHGEREPGYTLLLRRVADEKIAGSIDDAERYIQSRYRQGLDEEGVDELVAREGGGLFTERDTTPWHKRKPPSSTPAEGSDS